MQELTNKFYIILLLSKIIIINCLYELNILCIFLAVVSYVLSVHDLY